MNIREQVKLESIAMAAHQLNQAWCRINGDTQGLTMKNTWREKARGVIVKVLDSRDDWTLTEARRALREAYPFGPRENYPYKAWCLEVRVQLAARGLIA